MKSIFSKRLCQMSILISMTVFSFVFAIACSSMSKRSMRLLLPMAKQVSMFRLSGVVGVGKSRYCEIPKKSGKGCKKYAYYKVNTCNPDDWKELKAGRYVLVPFNEL